MQVGASASSGQTTNVAVEVERIDAAAAPFEKQAVSAAIARISGQAAADLRPAGTAASVDADAGGQAAEQPADPVETDGTPWPEEADTGTAALRQRSGLLECFEAAGMRPASQALGSAPLPGESSRQAIDREAIVAESIVQELIDLQTIAQELQAECAQLEALLEQAEQVEQAEQSEEEEEDDDDDDGDDLTVDIDGLAAAVQLSALVDHVHHVGKSIGSTGRPVQPRPQRPRTAPKAPYPRGKGKGPRWKRRSRVGRRPTGLES